jgi:hypothetical protein
MNETAQIIIATSTLIAAIGTMIGVVVGALISWRNGRGINDIKVATDGMQTKLEMAAHAAGKEEGRVAGEAKAAVLAEGKLEPRA